MSLVSTLCNMLILLFFLSLQQGLWSHPTFRESSMNELDSLRQEAETLKNAIRVSITFSGNFTSITFINVF